MAIHKLYIDEFDETDYRLVAIHTTLEDYRLAYFINRNLPVNLKKSNNDIQIRSVLGENYFTRFTFEDKSRDNFWNLIQNKNSQTQTSSFTNSGLFSDTNTDFSTKVYLLPEYKNVDFFLKIENTDENFAITNIVNQLKKIERISTVYSLDAEKIKSKNNLIF